MGSTEDYVYIDAGISSKSKDRPAFKTMMQAAQEGAYPAIITKDTYEAAHKRLQALRPDKQKA